VLNGQSLTLLPTLRWLRFFVQTPELHLIRHQYDVHSYHYSEMPIRDSIFGSYRSAVCPACRT